MLHDARSSSHPTHAPHHLPSRLLPASPPPFVPADDDRVGAAVAEDKSAAVEISHRSLQEEVVTPAPTAMHDDEEDHDDHDGHDHDDEDDHSVSPTPAGDMHSDHDDEDHDDHDGHDHDDETDADSTSGAIGRTATKAVVSSALAAVAAVAVWAL